MAQHASTALPSGHLIVTGHLAGAEAWRLYVATLRALECPAAMVMDPICTPSGGDDLDQVLVCPGIPPIPTLARLASLPDLAFVWNPSDAQKAAGVDAIGKGLDAVEGVSAQTQEAINDLVLAGPPTFHWMPLADTGPFESLPEPVVDALARDGGFIEQDGRVWCARCGHSCGGCGDGFGDDFPTWLARQDLSAHIKVAALAIAQNR